MTALAKETTGSIRVVNKDKRPLAANVKAIKGGVVACNSAGYYCPSTGAATEVVVGARFAETVDNTGGAAGAKSANVKFFRERTLLLQANDAGTPVAIAGRERAVYQLDDQTVTGNDTKSYSGVTYDVTSEGVWVDYSAGPRGPQGEPG